MNCADFYLKCSAFLMLGDDAFLILPELARNVFWRVSPNLRCSLARKTDKPT